MKLAQSLSIIVFMLAFVIAKPVPVPNCNPDATDCSCSGLFCTREVRQRGRGGRAAEDPGFRFPTWSNFRHKAPCEHGGGLNRYHRCHHDATRQRTQQSTTGRRLEIVVQQNVLYVSDPQPVPKTNLFTRVQR
ncbi:hypothetical protein EXIGLDRAFT_366179 [Exidia glandulosa HHB12029]|uniref:Uncharacterized protein n=1 Tax=Exidia glandulosa HHB12029 TaxID=1314781 RepID=A0A165L6I8_EXIGL|nr:hypothetical protein EXIGLDRAFT_366179 [Exidia glandulosa HHB12029]